MIESSEGEVVALNDRMERVARTSAWLSYVSQSAALLLLIANALLWLIPEFALFAARTQSNLDEAAIALTTQTRLLALAVSSAYVGLLAFALWMGGRLLSAFARGEIFVPRTGTQLRRMGVALLVFAVLSPVFRAVIAVVVTFAKGPGARTLAIGIGGQDIVLALIAALLIMLGHVMARAADIAEDNRQIV